MKPLLRILSPGDSSVPAAVVRRPFVAEVIDFESPVHAGTVFGIKRVSIAENIKRQNLASKVRYVQNDESGELVSERDFPMGTLQLETVGMTLAAWNIHDENDHPVPITLKTIQEWLEPREFDFLYSKALEVNPMWAPGGDSDTKAN
jgi:hypothetical protein